MGVHQTHPVNDSNDYDDEEIIISEVGDLQPAFVLNEHQSNSWSRSSYVQLLENERYLNILSNIYNPDNNLDLDKIKVVKFSSELLMNLDLQFNAKGKLFKKRNNLLFDKDVGYNSDEKERLNRVLITDKGYLNNEENYINVDPKFLTEFTKSITLRNSRVILYWRNLDIDFKTAQRILSLGLGYIIGAITKAELIYEIREAIVNETFDVSISIDYKKNTYVLIGLEGPIFNK